ncbi:MAG TPA: Type 1 glutamine amidotransferase-like domain-containing protein [Candidatus Saccharimonadales bacterium]|nr:Type 1 glutamine amidotransferase-like domain-containing protein [Candidatus Saccharimonadales bacterium]
MSVVAAENLNFVMSGTALLQEPVTQEALELTGAENPRVLLVGTAKPTQEKFDDFLVKAITHFGSLGITPVNLHDFSQAPSKEEATHKIQSADMLWVTGGDTLQLIDFWEQHGIASEIGKAAANGTVLSGGSAGMLAWFEQGHSDSFSYRVAEGEPWDYMFVRGLGYIAATGCPHYDSRTKGGAPRKDDFYERFRADASVPSVGIGITNRAALAIHDNTYRVVAVPDASKPAEVHIFRRTDSEIADELLPISGDYQTLPF